MKKIKFSVIVPILNNVEKLQATLDSILVQKEDMEILCIASGVTEDELSSLITAEKEDKRVRFLQEGRKNCGFLLNHALREAKGEYISVLQPGDVALKGMFRNLAKVADEERLDFILGDFEAEGDSCLNTHASYYGQVFSPVDAYSEEESRADAVEQETEQAKIPWLELARCIENGLYRRSFLRKNKIKFNEFTGVDVPVISFWFQSFLHAERVCLLDKKCCRLSEIDYVVSNVFNEYDFIANLLHRNEGLLERYRSMYGRAYIQDILANVKKISSSELVSYMGKAAAALRDLHDDGLLDYYALTPEEHKAVTDIMYDTEKFVEDKSLGETPRMAMEFMFPYHMFPEKSKIVIYGSGNVGRTIYRQAVHDGYVNIVGLVDKNIDDLEDGDIQVSSVNKLAKLNFDYILLAIRDRSTADKAKQELIKQGISEAKIKWDGTAYFRDDFYRNMYFPMLREWNENYAEHGAFVKSFGIKMKGSINDHIFPYHLFWVGTKVALYGAGDIGKKYYRQAIHDGYVKIAGIVDKNPAAIYAPDVPVKGMGELKKMDFDYVLITVHGGSAINAIKEDLRKMGIPDNKIKWDGNTYYRDEFYRNVYFPLLRQVGGDFLNISHLMDQLLKRLRYAIYDHVFPYHLFEEGESIAIYGAGDVGMKFYQQVKNYGWVKCVVIVDKNAGKINTHGIPVAPVGALKQYDYDKVLISMTNEKYANEAKETLIRMGISEERIKWAGKIYWRDNFYQHYWFDYLKFIREMRKSKI